MILSYAIFIRALLSWLPNIPYNGFFKILFEITDPLLKPFQRLRFGSGGLSIDISPVLAYITILIIRRTILPAVFRLFL